MRNNKRKPILTIVRGLPGSGKSTYARKLADETGAMLIEPDALLVTGGEYHYTQQRYIYALVSARRMLRDAVICNADVIYADVLPEILDVRVYCMAVFDGLPDEYTLRVHDMPLLTVEESMARNRHAIRRKDIERMAATWEPWEPWKEK